MQCTAKPLHTSAPASEGGWYIMPMGLGSWAVFGGYQQMLGHYNHLPLVS